MSLTHAHRSRTPHRFIRFHHEITVGISMDAFDWLARVLGQDAVENLAHAQNFLCSELEIGDLAVADLARWLVQQHS